MSRFEQMDIKLDVLAKKLNAKLTKDRPGYPEMFRTFEERRIDWNENNIHKAIIIQPNFENDGVNSKIWNFINIAWFDNAKSISKSKWLKKLVDKDNFETIDLNIDKLLSESIENLKNITLNDLFFHCPDPLGRGNTY